MPASIALSARTLNPDLVLVARAADPHSESKLRRVGVQHVVSPYALSGQRMAVNSLRPLSGEGVSSPDVLDDRPASTPTGGRRRV